MGQVPGVSPLLLGRHLRVLPGGIRLSAPPAPRRATHRRGLGLLRRGRPFQQIPRECHPQTGITLPAGCVVSAPLPSLSGPPLARGRLPDGGGTFLRKGHIRFPFPNPSLEEREDGLPQIPLSRGRPLALDPITQFLHTI